MGAGLLAKAACQPTPIYLIPCDQTVGAGLPAMTAWQPTLLYRVHIHSCGNGHLGFRLTAGHFRKAGMPAQTKVTKALLPHHSAPRLGSVCPNTALNPWAAATRHPWRGAANPASCRVAHEFKPAFGQRGLTGRLRSKARSRSQVDQDQERLASHRGYRWLLQLANAHAAIEASQKSPEITDPPPSQASQLPH